MKAVFQADARGVCITAKPAERPMSLPFANNQPGRLFHCLPRWKKVETPSRLRGCNQKNAAGLCQSDLCHEFTNAPVADERGVSVFRIDHEALAWTHGDECLRTLSEKDDVVFSVVWRVFLAQIVGVAPAKGFLTFQEHVYVGIDAVGLQTLLLRRVALRLAVVDKKAVAVEFNAAKRSIEQIVGADVVKKLFEERVFFFETLSVFQIR